MKHAPHLSGMRLPENTLGALLLASMLLVSACAPEVPVTSISDIKRSTPEPQSRPPRYCHRYLRQTG